VSYSSSLSSSLLLLGISVKTQELYLLVFVMRYLDLFTMFYSMYNSILKVIYIVITAVTIIQIKYRDPIKSVYDRGQDSFPHWTCAAAPCLTLAFFVVPRFTIMQWLWQASIFLEAIAILPQLIVLRKYRLVENLTGKFMLCLGSYRVLYIANWIYRSHTEEGYQQHWPMYTSGVVQALLYVDFFYQYFVSRCLKEKGDDDDSDDEGLIFELSVQEEQDKRRRQVVSSMPDSTKPLIVVESMMEEEKSDLEYPDDGGVLEEAKKPVG